MLEYNRAKCQQNAGYICQNSLLNQVKTYLMNSVESNSSSNLARITSQYPPTDFSSQMSTISVAPISELKAIDEAAAYHTRSNNADLFKLTTTEIAAMASGIALLFLIISIAFACACFKSKNKNQAKTKTNNLTETKIRSTDLQNHIEAFFMNERQRSSDVSFQQSTKSSIYILPSTAPPYVNGCFTNQETKKSIYENEAHYENTQSKCSYFELFVKEADYENQPVSILPYASSCSLNSIYEIIGNDVVEIV